jgi:putative SOS response-associated peptidase YedK
MCYDISFTAKLKELPNYFPEIVDSPQLELEFEHDHIIAHRYPEYPIVRRTSDDKVIMQEMEWGVIPFYVKDEKSFIRQRASMLNARSERILDDPKSVWYKIKNRRCLIPVSGIFEHRGIVGWKNKVPYFITLKDQPMFFLPGLYATADLPDLETGEVVKRYTFTLITRPANLLLKNIHNDGDHRYRMPLFLSLELSKKWIEAELPETEYREIQNYEMPPDNMNYIPVWTIRSPKARPDGKLKTEFWEWKDLPALGEKNPPEKAVIEK